MKVSYHGYKKVSYQGYKKVSYQGMSWVNGHILHHDKVVDHKLKYMVSKLHIFWRGIQFTGAM